MFPDTCGRYQLNHRNLIVLYKSCSTVLTINFKYINGLRDRCLYDHVEIQEQYYLEFFLKNESYCGHVVPWAVTLTVILHWDGCLSDLRKDKLDKIPKQIRVAYFCVGFYMIQMSFLHSLLPFACS